MFKKLKDKIAEEVKQSPARWEQILNTAQAAVSSASSSSNSDENVTSNTNQSSEYSSSANENFFSLSEDTPQNSPMKIPLNNSSSTPSSSKTVSVDLYSPSSQSSSIVNNGTSFTSQQRTRRLSNSSVASDVSFRLPHYESQPAHNIQSDWESASEAEDSGLAPSVDAQLEQISKEHIYQAYRNSLDKYQKYRGRYTDIVRRFRELEKENAKARQVLVETQDKALRRISELKEQCQLEQQAKAHLESALRLEMDDMQCVVKTLKTKLELLGENPDHILNGSSSKEDSLINFSSEGDTSNEHNELINRLEKEINDLKKTHTDEISKHESTIKQLTDQLESSQKEIDSLKNCEEENNITMAQNKMMIHSELENKESEVKKYKEMIAAMEVNEKSLTTELKAIKEKFNKQAQDFETVSNDKLKLEERLKEVFEEKKTVNNELKDMKDKIEKVNNKFKELADDKASLQNQNEGLSLEIKKCKDEINELQRQKILLNEEIKSIKIISESTESETINTLQESMRKTVAELETNLHKTKEELNKIIEDKSIEMSSLTSKHEEMLEKYGEIEKERDTCKSKIDSLKNEKRDLEKTLEREIREKNELKAQVTNILQEIGRLEEQLKEVRSSHSSIQAEKQKLEEKIEKIQRQHNESKSKLEKDHIHKWQTKVKELESKLQEIQCENSQLAEKNCLLEESSRRNSDEIKRLQSNLSENQVSLRDEHDRLINHSSKLEEEILTLNDRITQLTGDHARLFDEKEQLDHQYRSLQDANEKIEKEKLCLMEDLKLAQEELNSCKSKVSQLETEKSNLTECCDNLRIVVNNIKTENEAMIVTRDELQKSFDNMKVEMDKLSGFNKNLSEKNKSLKSELDTLNAKNQNRLTELENMLKLTTDEKQSLTESLHKNATDIEKKMKNYEEIKIQNEYLQTLVNQLQTDLSNLKDELASKNELSKEIDEKNDVIKNLKELSDKLTANIQAEKIELSTKVNELEIKLNSLSDYDGMKEQLASRITENNELSAKLKEFEIKLCEYDKLVMEMDILRNEKKEVDSKFNLLENRCKELEVNHSVMENQRKEVDEKYEALQKHCKEVEEQHAKTQKELESIQNEIQTVNDKFNQINDEKVKLEKEIESSRSIISDLNKDFNDNLKEMEALREEKAKLIEEVESHNMKISTMDKELNTVESMKTSDKYESLQMENSKLLEKLENLEKTSERRISDMTQEIEELQENSQHFAQINSEFNELKVKYDQLVKETANKSDDESGNSDGISSIKTERDELADKLKKIMIEVEDVSNKNLFLEQKVENYLILEQSNERLKLTNEKLMRQLDETLVSMHHNEGIQANTEFEYLRNILFQYLSGHVNANGTTLVKVIAAVLKFTPQQTQLVIDKEVQRHTLLGQLNNFL
ncbi:golgin subfamily A member 4 [Chironomus tepperi]|uniref:golgin subfamily A member 4 n=1 Tax=Chironomus tepperi TaxID=113505 RepID=UPI00391FAD5A